MPKRYFWFGYFLFSLPLFGCGIALVRLRNPLATYKDCCWGARLVCSLLEEQRNRGQDGAGIAIMQLEMPSGFRYLHRVKRAGSQALDIVVQSVINNNASLALSLNSSIIEIKKKYHFIGELYLGHVRYATHSSNDIHFCQPYISKNSIAATTLALAGNFNLTNTQQLYEQLVQYGLTPIRMSDTQMVLELLSYFLKQQYQFLTQQFAHIQGTERAVALEDNIDLIQVIQQASQYWDGGYVFAGMIGSGQAFVCRDPAGIRPAFFYANEEVIAVASERSALMNVFGVSIEAIHEIKPAHVLLIKKDGSYFQKPFTQKMTIQQCSFERIYFSRAHDPQIYQERKMLGKQLAQSVVNILKNTDDVVLTYVPHSSEVAFVGLLEELQEQIPLHKVRMEKLIYKNQQHRTFIMPESERLLSVPTAYSTTKGIITPETTIVVVDDSIVRGTTLRKSLIPALIQLNPKRIIVVSSAPPVLYPDCYGIDMSQLGSFIGFQATVALLKERNQEKMLEEIYQLCKQQENLPPEQMINYVNRLYEYFTQEALIAKISKLLRPRNSEWQGEIAIIYQTTQGLHNALSEDFGDWYFTGLYPTPGGLKVLNTSYIKWYEGSNERAY